MLKAQERYNILRPFLDGERQGRAALETHLAEAKPAENLRLSVATAYRLLGAFKACSALTSLVPEQKDKGRGKSRLKDKLQDLAMTDVINRHWLQKGSKATRQFLWETELPRYCRLYGCEIPQYAVFCRRILNLDPKMASEKRDGRYVARRRFGENKGSNPLGTEPLACIQIDFWTVDNIMVDPFIGEALTRPFLCLATDVYTGMPFGYHLSLDAPCIASAALAIVNGVLPKEEPLRRLGVNFRWPIYGLIKAVHVDGASYFTGAEMRSLLTRQGIDVVPRLHGMAHFGGSIESQFAALATKVSGLPGATGGHIRGKPAEPARTAALMMDEFECIFLNLIKKKINHRSERGKLSPLEKWDAFFDQDKHPGRELPKLPADPITFRIEMLPSQDATLGARGIRYNYRFYDSRELSSMKGLSPDRWAGGLRFHYDPRNIASIYVLNPQTQRYIEVPAVDQCAMPRTLALDKAVRQYNHGMDRSDAVNATDEANQGIAQIIEKARSRKGKRARRLLTQSARSMDEHARDPVRLHESDESDQKVCTAGPRVPTHDDGTDDDVLELDYSL